MRKLETERLSLKLYTAEDKQDFISLWTNAAVMKYVDTGVISIAEAEKLWVKLTEDFYPKGVDTIFAVFSKNDGKYIGNAAIRPRPSKKEDWEITYVLQTEAWGRGFATEIAKRLFDFGFNELNFAEVFATIHDDNFDSIKVVEKAGMSFLRYEYDEDGRFSVYSIKK